MAYQTGRGPRGAYMLCALFKSYLLLATFQMAEDRFYCRFLLSLTDLRIERIEDGKGMNHGLMFV